MQKAEECWSDCRYGPNRRKVLGRCICYVKTTKINMSLRMGCLSVLSFTLQVQVQGNKFNATNDRCVRNYLHARELCANDCEGNLA